MFVVKRTRFEDVLMEISAYADNSGESILIAIRQTATVFQRRSAFSQSFLRARRTRSQEFNWTLFFAARDNQQSDADHTGLSNVYREGGGGIQSLSAL